MSRKAKKKPAAGLDQAAPGSTASRTPEAPARIQDSETRRSWWFVLLLISAALAAYWPALHGGFIIDDADHISGNETLRSPGGLWSIWFKPGATMQYYPLSFTVFWIERHLWGLHTPGYHLVNVLLHGTSAVLLWQVLERLKVRGAWLAGALFALHPVCVMSVAWMTELKNTLSAALALCAAWAYLRAAGLGVYGGKVDGSRLDWRFYLLSLVLFQLAMFAKTAVSFLPVTLLLLTWWCGRRLNWRMAWPVLPMFAIAVGMGLVTIFVERHSGSASGQRFDVPFLQRVLISGRSFWFYLGKLLLPYPLTFSYERWQVDAKVWWQHLFPAATVAVLAATWWLRGRIGRGLFVALMHFFVATSLLILIVVPYFTLFSFVSDHWQYFGCMSVMALAGWGIVRVLEAAGAGRPLLQPLVCGALLLALGALTWHQCGMYTDAETLWRSTLAQNPRIYLAQMSTGELLLHQGRFDEARAHYQLALDGRPDDPDALSDLGNAFVQMGRLDEAMAMYLRALELRPNEAANHYNLGNVLAQTHRVDEAIAQFERALELRPADALAHRNLGNLLYEKGRVDDAIVHFQKALEIRPDDAVGHFNLGSALFHAGRVDEAIARYQEAVRLKPDYAEAHNNLAFALMRKGQPDEAISHLQRALQSQPDYASARYNLGSALLQKGRLEEAAAQFQATLRIQPGFTPAQSRLVDIAWVLATSPDSSVRNGNRAVELAQPFAGSADPAILGTLAAAYAEVGRMPDAVASARRALELATAQPGSAQTAKLREQLVSYEAGRPFRDTNQTNPRTPP